jgi:hypothetical protein
VASAFGRERSSGLPQTFSGVLTAVPGRFRLPKTKLITGALPPRITLGQLGFRPGVRPQPDDLSGGTGVAMALGLRRGFRLWEAVAPSPGDHGTDQGDGAERRVADSAGRPGCSAGVMAAREFPRILTSTPAFELASDDVLRLEGIARPVTLYGSVRDGPRWRLDPRLPYGTARQDRHGGEDP